MTKPTQKSSNKTVIILLSVGVAALILTVSCIVVLFLINSWNTSGNDLPAGTIAIDNLNKVNVKQGDVFSLTVEYKPSTGYGPIDPVYDASSFELVDTEETHSNGYGTGGDNSTRTYFFKALKKVNSAEFQTGIFRSWEPTSIIIQDDVIVTVN